MRRISVSFLLNKNWVLSDNSGSRPQVNCEQIEKKLWENDELIRKGIKKSTGHIMDIERVETLDVKPGETYY